MTQPADSVILQLPRMTEEGAESLCNTLQAHLQLDPDTDSIVYDHDTETLVVQCPTYGTARYNDLQEFMQDHRNNFKGGQLNASAVGFSVGYPEEPQSHAVLIQDAQGKLNVLDNALAHEGDAWNTLEISQHGDQLFVGPGEISFAADHEWTALGLRRREEGSGFGMEENGQCPDGRWTPGAQTPNGCWTPRAQTPNGSDDGRSGRSPYER
jgi:hypothetical protein